MIMRKNVQLIVLAIVVLTYSAVGQAPDFQWATGMGDYLNQEGKSICTDDVGNVYSTGNFFGTIDSDPGIGVANLTSNGGSDYYIQKLDINGNLLWAHSFGGVTGDEGVSIPMTFMAMSM